MQPELVWDQPLKVIGGIVFTRNLKEKNWPNLNPVHEEVVFKGVDLNHLKASDQMCFMPHSRFQAVVVALVIEDRFFQYEVQSIRGNRSSHDWRVAPSNPSVLAHRGLTLPYPSHVAVAATTLSYIC